MAEIPVQRLVLGRLELLRPRVFFWRANTGMARRPGAAPVYFGLPGQPDVLGVAGGRAFGIETKAKGKRQSAVQREWQRDWERAGGLYLLAVGGKGALAAVAAVAALVEGG